jgi:hypothetical protein
MLIGKTSQANVRRSATSLLAAFVIVAIATVAWVVKLKDPTTAWPPWPVVVWPVVPAWWIAFTLILGGPHGRSVSRLGEIAATVIIASVMWWIVIDTCRVAYKRLRGRGNAATTQTTRG